MLRVAVIVLAGALLALTGLVGAMDDPPGSEKTKADAGPVAGSWKLSIPAIGGGRPLWLVTLAQKDSKWTGELSKSDDVPPTTIDRIAVDGELLTFNLVLGDEKPAPKPGEKPATFSVEIKVPKGAGDKLYGTVLLPNKSMQPVLLEKTALTALDSYAMNKEILAKSPDSPEAVKAGLDLLQGAKAKKATKDEVKAWAAKTVKTAEKFGPRYSKYAVQRVAELLGGEEDFADLGIEYARQAEKMLTAKDSGIAHKQALELLATALETAGKKDEAKETREMAKKIDLGLKPAAFAGRKAKSDRVVLVELFTGAQCPPCVAADLAFDGLAKAYKPGDVVLLEYHLHVPLPDPLANDETDERANYYGKEVTGTPTFIINGSAGPDSGGGWDEAEDKYDDLTAAINPLLEKAADLKVSASATEKDGKIDVKADVTVADKPEDRLRLRLVLIEEKVDYTGSNSIAEHHHVVRMFPGGSDGFAVKEKTLSQSVTVDLAELKADLQKDLKKYLAKWVAKNPGKKAPEGQPLELKNLKLVAFVQNQDTHDILQAVQVDVKPAK